jgi:hypothetical protein
MIRTGCFDVLRASRAAATSSARRLASAAIGRRQSKANGFTSWSSKKNVARSS